MNLALILLILRWIGASMMIIDMVKSIWEKLSHVRNPRLRTQARNEVWQLVWKHRSAKPKRVSASEQGDIMAELNKINEKLTKELMRS
jgi:hypothetical protein